VRGLGIRTYIPASILGIDFPKGRNFKPVTRPFANPLDGEEIVPSVVTLFEITG
jgi:hypothetical protein